MFLACFDAGSLATTFLGHSELDELEMPLLYLGKFLPRVYLYELALQQLPISA